jgi:hypothetical protein
MKWLRACAIAPALIFVAVGVGFLLREISVLVSGMPDPSYAYPAALRIGLAFELAGSAFLVSRFAPERSAATAVWVVLSSFGLAIAIVLPGFSPYFLIPSLVAALCLFAATRVSGNWEGWIGTAGMLVPALVALLVWSSIGATGEMIMGLKLHPMFTVPFAIALSTLVPLFARYTLPRSLWIGSVAVFFVVAICAAVVQGLQPSFSTNAAQRLSISYVENRERAFWTVDATAPVPQPMRAVATFSPRPRRMLDAFPRVYAAPAGNPLFPVPNATVIARPPANGVRRVTILFHGSDATDQMYLVVPRTALLKTVDVQGWHFLEPASWSEEDSVLFACMSRDCRNKSVTLTLALREPVTLALYEHRFGLPGIARNLLRARPPTAVPSQNGDGVTLVGEVHVPAT